MLVSYGDISPRTAAYVVKNLLTRALPYLVLEKFGQVYVIPTNSTKSAKFRRYEALPLATTPLTEGVSPVGKSITYSDVTANLYQYGDFVPLTDIIADTHEDRIFSEVQTIIAEQAAQTIEAVRYGVLKAGTNVYFTGTHVQRDQVATALTSAGGGVGLTTQRRITRGFKRQNARYITKITSSSPNYGTAAVQAAYVGLVHPDMENDIRSLTGFQNAKDYANPGSMLSEYEFGTVEDVRYIRSTVFESFPNAGGAKGSMVSTAGVKADVYPVLYLAADAYGIVPLKGKDSISPIVFNPGTPSDSDPLGQRGFVGWKCMTTAVILNQLWMARLEAAATDL
jgi:N4-gp56 family major capsid protein